MGIELAAEARRRGWNVLLVLGPTSLAPPEGVSVLAVRSAAAMHEAVLQAFAHAEALVMAAAVADYTPADPVPDKLHKEDGDLMLRLVRTRDILQSVAAHPHRAGACVVGFSLDAEVDEARAREKMTRKDLDAIVVNSVRSFGGGDSDARLLPRRGEIHVPEAEEKGELARVVLSWIEAFRAERGWHP